MSDRLFAIMTAGATQAKGFGSVYFGSAHYGLSGAVANPLARELAAGSSCVIDPSFRSSAGAAST